MSMTVRSASSGHRAMKETPPPATGLWSFRMIPFLKSESYSEPIRLTDEERAKLLNIGMRIRLPARMIIYHGDSPAQWVFIVADGVVKSYCELPSGKRSIAAFLFPRDLFGLAANGHYVNTTQTVTQVMLYRLPAIELTTLLKHDGEMQFKFLAKVTHELRESQRRAILIGRRDAAGRLAMFVSLMTERLDPLTPDKRVVPLPMTRSDIAGFLNLSLESVSRAAAELERRGLLRFESHHTVRVLDAPRLGKLAGTV